MSKEDYCHRGEPARATGTPLKGQPIGLGGGGAISAPVFSPDSKRMAVVCDMNGLYLRDTTQSMWNMVDGHEMLGFGGNPFQVAIAFDPAMSTRFYAYSPFRGLRYFDGSTWTTIGDPTFASTLAGMGGVSAIGVINANNVLLGTQTGVFLVDPTAVLTSTHLDTPVLTGQVLAFLFLQDVTLPHSPLYFAALRSGVFSSSTAKAGTWLSVGIGLPSGTIQSVVGAFEQKDPGSSRLALYALYEGPPSWIFRCLVDAAKPLATAPWGKATGTGIAVSRPHRYLGMALNACDTVYVTPADGSNPEVFKSTDGGTSWSPILKYTWPPRSPADPSNVTTVGWLEVEPRGNGFGTSVRGIAVSPNDANTAIITNESGVYLTTDGGAKWAAIYTQAMGTEPSTVPMSKTFWSSIGLEVTTTWNYVVVNSKVHLICYSDIVIARSQDGGASWAYTGGDPADGKVPDGWRNTIYEVAVDPTNNTHLYAAVSGQHDIPHPLLNGASGLDPRYNTGGVVESTDGGQNWKQFDATGLLDRQAVSIVINPNMPKQVWVALFGDGVYRYDGAAPWSQVTQGFLPTANPNLNCYRLHFHPDGTLFCVVTGKPASTSSPTDLGGGLYSLSKAETLATSPNWHCRTTKLLSDPNNPPPGGNTIIFPLDFAINPADSSDIYLCVACPGPRRWDARFGLYHGTIPSGTTDPTWVVEKIDFITGTNYPDLNQGFPRPFAPFFDPSDSSILYLTTATHGIWKKTGGLWSEYKEIPFNAVHRIAFDPISKMKYITTFGGGVWKVP